MKAATLNELQKELSTLPPKRILEICMRLAKHKKETKELLTYLLFESDDEEAYKRNIKKEVEEQFESMNKSNLYLAKKSLRKILRMINKFIRYSGIKETEAELRIDFCNQMNKSGIPFNKNKVLVNLYDGQVKKINIAVSKLHEDLQFDYQKEIEKL